LVCFDAVVLWWPDSGRDMLVENQDLIRFRGENNGTEDLKEVGGTHLRRGMDFLEVLLAWPLMLVVSRPLARAISKKRKQHIH
jgi:hypothetical protein